MNAPATKANRTRFITVRVTEDEDRWLKDEAAKTDRSVAALMRRALREYIERREEPS